MRFTIGLLCLFSFILTFFITDRSSAQELSVGFIYKNPPEEALYIYDWLVVDPDSFFFEKMKERFYIKKLPKLIAYVSINEMETGRSYFNKTKPEWIVGENKNWGTKIFDIRKEDYQKFLFEEILAKYKEFDGFFFDTIDSYKIIQTDKDGSSYEKALSDFIKKIRKLYPEKIILVNRGFEIFSEIKNYIDGVVAESLFYGFDPKNKTYEEMNAQQTNWLLEKLRDIKKSGKPVIVIDYVPPYDKELALNIAKKISEEGFLPYVTDWKLNTIGTTEYQLIPRKILVLYNGESKDSLFTNTHKLYQVHLEYLGFVPVFYDISKGLPEEELSDLYAGIIVEVDRVDDEKALFDWLETNILKGLKVFFVDSIPFSEFFLRKLSIENLGLLNPFEKVEIIQSSLPFFETEPYISGIDMLYPKEGNPLILAKNKNKIFTPLAKTPWGGYAQEGAFVNIIGEFNLFVFDPVEVFRTIFNPDFPSPDVTTENGRRILTVHLDGDSFFGKADFSNKLYVGEILRDRIFKKFPIPHTVSLIEGETAPYGLYPERSKELEAIARDIFSLENVEPASHSFSHPFTWSKTSYDKDKPIERYNLPIRDYVFNLEREIIGSVNYIKKLIPHYKKIKIFHWTGVCNPNEEALSMVYKAGLYNINGGNTVIEAKKPFLSLIGPLGINKGEYFQIFAPLQNENVYTELWTKTYAYTNVISAFNLTESPRRYKPISIYYHFFSGQKLASLKALEEVYRFAISQETNPRFLSEYAQKVLEFRNTVFLKNIRNNSLSVKGEGNLRTIRLDKNIKIDMKQSEGIVGFKKINNSTYIHLSEKGNSKIIFAEKDPGFYLIDANGWIEKYEKSNKVYKIWLKAHVPLQFRIFNSSCNVKVIPEKYRLISEKEIHQFSFQGGKEAYVEATCDN